MKIETTEGIDLRTASTAEITEAMARGVQAALSDHKRAGRSIVVWDWENGRVAHVPPDQIDEPADDPAESNGAGAHRPSAPSRT